MIYNFDDLIFQILSINKITHESGKFNVKGRPYAALSYRIKGRGNFEINKNKFTVNSGDILFIPANISYNVEYIDTEMIVIHFEDCNYHEIENIITGNSEYFHQKFNDLLNNWQKTRSIIESKSEIYKILYKLSESNSESSNNEMFMMCKKHIDENFTLPTLTVESVCDYAYTTHSTLLRMFHKYLGISPKEYILKLRFGKAVDLLLSKKYTIEAISEMCGFSDVKYFARIFKKIYNQTPSAFRKQNKIQ